MSFLKKLFGFGSSDESAAAAPAAPAKSVEYEGFVIHAAPYKEAGQYQTAGTVEKEVGGVKKEHRFIRAERHPSLDEAVEFSLMKGRQLVDEQGERMFA
jgi:hypothetical protein